MKIVKNMGEREREREREINANNQHCEYSELKV